jgi:hypothetical protein
MMQNVMQNASVIENFYFDKTSSLYPTQPMAQYPDLIGPHLHCRHFSKCRISCDAEGNAKCVGVIKLFSRRHRCSRHELREYLSSSHSCLNLTFVVEENTLKGAPLA